MDIKEKQRLAEKQKFWAEQLPNFEAKYWLPSHFAVLVFDMTQGNYVIKDGIHPDFEDDATEIYHRVNTGWAMWKKAITFSQKQAQAVPEGFAIKDVIHERQRQISQEFYSTENDDEYKQNELLRAAVCYAENVVRRGWVFDSNFGPDIYQEEEAPDLWPWDLDFWKPKSPRRDLVRAAALIIAEIERIDRSTGASQ